MAINSRLLKVRVPRETHKAIEGFKRYALNPPYINYWKNRYKLEAPETKFLLITLIQMYGHSSKNLKSIDILTMKYVKGLLTGCNTTKNTANKPSF